MWADIGTGHTLDAAILPQLEETVGSHRKMLILHTLESVFCEETHFGRSDEVLVRTYLFKDGGQVLVRVLVDSNLLVHIKNGQVVIHHQEGTDIVHGDTLTLTKLIPVLGNIHAEIAIGYDGKHIRRLE